MKRCKNKRKLAVLGLAAAMAPVPGGLRRSGPVRRMWNNPSRLVRLPSRTPWIRGWVDQAWVDAYYEGEQRSRRQQNRESNMVGDFATTTLSGEAFTREQLGDVVFFAFLDPEAEGTQVFYNALAEGYGGVAENGAEILVCTKSGTGSEMFADAPFPVILYNDSLAAAVGSNRSMVEDGGDAKRRLLVCERNIPLCMVFRRGRRGAACVRGRLCGDEPERRVPVWDGGRGGAAMAAMG